MANNWTTAVSESDFVTLTNGASPALLDHTALIAAGVTKCTDRKAVLRKYVCLSSSFVFHFERGCLFSFISLAHSDINRCPPTHG